MLLTEYGFEERLPARQHPAQRFQAWRYVGISTESTCFLIDSGADQPGVETGARARLCASASELLDSLDRLGNVDHCVYWLDFSEEEARSCRLMPVVALFRYASTGATWFNFMSHDGTIHSCDSHQPDPANDSGWTMVWAVW